MSFSSSMYDPASKRSLLREVLGVRHVQALLLAGSLFVTQMQQANIGIALVAMTEKQNTTHYKTYDWDKEKRSMITGSFFYSVMLFNLIGGYLTTKLNTKIMLVSAIAVTTFTTYLTPMLIKFFDWKALFSIKIIQGAATGVVKPSVYSQMVRWLPPDEVRLIGPMILTGISFGVGFILVMGGYLGTGQGGWPSIFYFSGNCGIMWCLTYIGLGSHNPRNCFYISNMEKRYIEDSLPLAIQLPYRYHVPWKQILVSLPLYALVISQAADNWAFEVFVKLMPNFYHQRHRWPLSTIGLLAGMPFAVLCCCTYITHFLLRYLLKKKMLHNTVVRHVCNGIGTGQFGSFYCFMLCSFSRIWYLSYCLHYLGFALGSFHLHGFYMNYIDLAPNFVGLCVGLCSCFGHVFSILGPYVSVYIYNKYNSTDELLVHQFIYFIIAMLYLWSGILWELMASTKIQPFNDIKDRKVKEEPVHKEGNIIKI